MAIIDLVLISGHCVPDPSQDRMAALGFVPARDKKGLAPALLLSDRISFRNTPPGDFFFSLQTERSKQVYHRKKRVTGRLISHLSLPLWIGEPRGRNQEQSGPLVLSQVTPHVW